MKAMIDVCGITKQFGTVTAVDNVSFTVQAGELLTLLGPSGCGKTTLLRLLSGFEQPTCGTIQIDGTDVTGTPPNRRDVNQVFQSYALFPHLTVHENVAFGLKMQRQARAHIQQKVEEILGMVGLQGLDQRYPHELSGGQRQRVALARAIVPKPRILLLDEPLSALDAKLRRSMQLELKRLQQQLGLTTILVTHDQDEALALSDRIAVMNGGRIEQLDTPERLYRSPQNAFVAEFIGESNVLSANVVGLDESPGGGTLARLRVAGGFDFVAISVETVWTIDQTCRVSLRPESIRVGAERTHSENEFPARLVEKMFLGPTVRGILEIRGASPEKSLRLTVFRPTDSFLGDAKIGSDVFCSCARSDVVLLR